MTELEYKEKLKKIKERNKQLEMRQKLREEKRKLFPKIKIPSTSKLILIAVFALNIQIIWYVEHVIEMYGDLSALYALIGVPATLIPTLLGYFSKAKAQNQIGGITYDMAMNNLQNQRTDYADDGAGDDNSVG